MPAPALVTLDECKLEFGIVDASEDAYINSKITQFSEVIQSYCNRQFQFNIYTEYLEGLNTPFVATHQRPIQLFTITATSTQGSPVLTGLAGFPANATNFPQGVTPFVNQSVTGPNLQQGTSILSVDSSTQVTLAQNATVSGTGQFVFGPAVWLDILGFAGQAPNAFPSSDLLIPGVDYIVVIDGDGGAGESGLLQRVGGVGPGGFPFFWPGYGVGQNRNTLTAAALPAWPSGMRNIKVQYYAGYLTIPAPVQAVCMMAIARQRMSRMWGAQPGSFSFRGLSVGFGRGSEGGFLTEDMRRMLAPWHEVSFGSQ